MMEVMVRLSDQATAKYFFGHQIGDRVRSRVGESEGTLKDATFMGSEDGGPFEVTCDVETDSGQIINIRLVDLVKVDA